MTERPSLHQAVAADLTAKQQARDEATRPEREAAEKQAKADAGLYGTAGWDALSDRRRARAAHHTVEQAGPDRTAGVADLTTAIAVGQAQGGGDDAA